MSELRNDSAGPRKATPKNEDLTNAPSLKPGGMAITAEGSTVVLTIALDTEAESGDISRTAQETMTAPTFHVLLGKIQLNTVVTTPCPGGHHLQANSFSMNKY